MNTEILLSCVILLSRFDVFSCKDIPFMWMPPVVEWSNLNMSPYLVTSSESSDTAVGTTQDFFPLLDVNLLNNTQIDLVSNMNPESFSATGMDKVKTVPMNAYPIPLAAKVRRDAPSKSVAAPMSTHYLTPDAEIDLKMQAHRTAAVPDMISPVFTKKPAATGKTRPNDVDEWIRGPSVNPELMVQKTFGMDTPMYKVYAPDNKDVSSEKAITASADDSVVGGGQADKDQIAEFVLGKGSNGQHELKRRQTLEQLKTQQRLIQSINNILEFIA